MKTWVVDPAKTGAIVPPTLTPNVKFHITTVIIQLLNLKGALSGEAIDDANMHLTNFIRICTSYTIPRVDQEALRLWLFPF